jgi:acyl carrier protein
LNQIDARLQEIARDVFGDDSLVLTDSTKVGKVSGWDSLGHVNFMLGVEYEFDVEFSEDEFVGFEDIGGLKRILAPKLVNPSVVSGVNGDGQRMA